MYVVSWPETLMDHFVLQTLLVSDESDNSDEDRTEPQAVVVVVVEGRRDVEMMGNISVRPRCLWKRVLMS